MKIYLYFGGRLIFRSPYIPKFTVINHHILLLTDANLFINIIYFLRGTISRLSLTESQRRAFIQEKGSPRPRMFFLLGMYHVDKVTV